LNSLYTEPYTLDVRTLFLPSVRGFGALPDLHIAMSLNEDLLDMVQVVATQSMEDLLDSAFNLEGKITDILYEWAGVTDMDPDGRGGRLSDDRMLEFLEEFLDRD